MPKRRHIFVGDKTTAGGTVAAGQCTLRWNGQPLAFEGDWIECPRCNSTGLIQCTGTRISMKGHDGRQAALEGDLCLCQCRPQPVLVASQGSLATEGMASP